MKTTYHYNTSDCGTKIYVHPLEGVYVKTPEKAEAILKALNILFSNKINQSTEGNIKEELKKLYNTIGNFLDSNKDENESNINK